TGARTIARRNDLAVPAVAIALGVRVVPDSVASRVRDGVDVSRNSRTPPSSASGTATIGITGKCAERVHPGRRGLFCRIRLVGASDIAGTGDPGPRRGHDQPRGNR